MSERRKPRGTSGIIEFSNGAAWSKQIVLPETKQGIERHVAEVFLDSPIDYGHKRAREWLGVESFVQNEESDLDFSLLRSGSPFMYLELAEFAPLSSTKHYDNVESWYSPLERAKDAYDLIAKKASKYVGVELPIALVVYYTEERLAIDETAVAALRYLMYTRPDAQSLALVFTRNTIPKFHSHYVYDKRAIERYTSWAIETNVTEASFEANTTVLRSTEFRLGR